MNATLFRNIGLAVLRIGAAALMLTHGYGKLIKLINGEGFADPLGIGATPSLFLTVGAEFVCPILIIIGLKTRIATVPLIITMAVAAFIVHGADPFQKKEMALVYLVMFVSGNFNGAWKI